MHAMFVVPGTIWNVADAARSQAANGRLLPMTRRTFLSILSGAPTLLGQQTARSAVPNIVVILADDLGYGDLGCYGQETIRTPNLDRMAASGMRFTDAYAGSAVCAPSRCSLLTGLHTGHCRVRANAAPGGRRVSLRPDDLTVAEALKPGGYTTGVIGKWGVGEAGTRGTPNQQGFDHWLGFLNQDHALAYYPMHLWRNEREWFPDGNQGTKRKDYVQDLFLEDTLGFLRDNKDRPFFLYLPYTMPHADSERSRDTGDGYTVKDYEGYESEAWDSADKGYAAMVTRLDRDCGRILNELNSLGLAENTLVLFISDNGPANEGRHSHTFFKSSGSVGGAPLRGRKGNLYEGGIRVPAIAYWPGVVPEGATSAHPWAFADLLPTIAELAGVDAPPSIDGESFAPVLRGGNVERKGPLYWELAGKPSQQAIREGKWKAIRSEKRIPELFDLARDPGETTNVASRYPDLAEAFAGKMESLRTESEDFPLWP